MRDLSKALTSLRPGAQWALSGDDYSGLVWMDNETTPPTIQELQAEDERLFQEWLSNQYQRDRVKEYPSIQDQLDMQYWDSVNGTTTWIDSINLVKTKYPKP